MLFCKTIFTAIVAAASVIAAPLEDRAPQHFTPSKIWKYNVGTGAISPTKFGVIDKSTGNGGQDITALLTFKYPGFSSGKKCQFAFYLDSTAKLRGSGKLDLFSSNSPAPGPTSSWPPGNQRNINLARLSASLGSIAKWDATYNAYLTQKTPCKAPGTVEGFELVGVYDNDFIRWNPSLSGPRIVVT